jgi:hypothetical protein
MLVYASPRRFYTHFLYLLHVYIREFAAALHVHPGTCGPARPGAYVRGGYVAPARRKARDGRGVAWWRPAWPGTFPGQRWSPVITRPSVLAGSTPSATGPSSSSRGCCSCTALACFAKKLHGGTLLPFTKKKKLLQSCAIYTSVEFDYCLKTR